MLNTEINDILEELRSLFPNAHCELIYHNIFELVIAVSLSAQTTDKAVNKVTPILFNKYPNPTLLKDARLEDIEQILKPIGMAKTKSLNIIKLSEILINKYHGQVPNTLEELESLPGVGRKTANVVLTEGFHIPRLPVDTHVERVAKRMGLVVDNLSVKEVEETLMKLIPKENWHEAHHLLLFMGRYQCFAKKPNCANCFYQTRCKYDKKPLA